MNGSVHATNATKYVRMSTAFDEYVSLGWVCISLSDLYSVSDTCFPSLLTLFSHHKNKTTFISKFSYFSSLRQIIVSFVQLLATFESGNFRFRI